VEPSLEDVLEKAEVTAQLAGYKALDPRWHEWSAVKAVLADLAEKMV
jgi:hypothetical protein